MKRKLYALSDSPFTNTGFSSQTLFLLNELDKKGYECHLQAHNYVGQTLTKGCVKLADNTPFNFTMYGNGREAYSKELLEPRIKDLKPDFFLILLDTFMVYPWYLQQNYAPAHSIFWFPSDGGGGLPNGCEQILKKCHYPVAMSKHGQKQVWDLYGIKAHYIPHGIDPNIFFPLKQEEKNKLKQKYNLQGKYVVGLMGRNQGRKMHDRAIKMFAKWCKGVPNAVLFMHLDPNDLAAVFSINELVNRYGIQNRVRYSGVNFFKGLTYKDMNEIYNVMDVYISSTSGEGFGIGTIEAMSCQIPVLNTSYTTTDELVTENQAGESIKLVGCDNLNVFEHNTKEYDNAVINGTITGSWSVERGLVDIDDGVIKLQKMYEDPEIRKFYGENGRIAVLKEYTIEHVSNEWDKFLKNIKT